MAEIALSAIQTLFAALQSPELSDFLSSFKPDLKELKETVSAIEKFLLDVDSMNAELTREQEGYIEKLKEAIYDADDLFDELHTKAQLKQLDNNDKLSKKVRTFFSSHNPLLSAANTSGEVKRIRKRLEDISANHAKFGFNFDSVPIRKRREETCSYVYSPSIIGRDDDVNHIIAWLLDPTAKQHVCFLTIVGIGGLGKTALAQLVYQDERIECVFKSRLWVCVSDQDGQAFEVKSILFNILESAGHKLDGGCSMERVQNSFQQNLGGKQCLLFLDDVWTEDRCKLQELERFFMTLGTGSKIIVTSRSRETARIIGNDQAHTIELAGLSEENSWSLFKLAAFGKAEENDVSNEFLEIGEKVVKQCRSLPLALKVVGSLLYGQKLSKWQALEQNGLEKINQRDKSIMSILKISYDNLDSSSKACFSYCALFPKDYKMKKMMLMNLWLAQGYIKPFYEGQSMIDAGNELFSILLRRCFFQDVKMDLYGEVESFKIHDLLHDVAQEVAGKEMRNVNSMRNSPYDPAMRHLFISWNESTNFSSGKIKLRSYLGADGTREYDWIHHVRLRALSFRNGREIVSVSDSICKCLHLRYLSLEDCYKLETLPKSISKLYNLQTLILRQCRNLVELPSDLSKLINLIHLDIRWCSKLSYMPEGMDKLSCLEVLTDFYVGKLEKRGKKKVGQLKDLKALKNLKGGIVIHFPDEKYVRDDEDGYLCKLKRLNKVDIIFGYYGSGFYECGTAIWFHEGDYVRDDEDGYFCKLKHLKKVDISFPNEEATVAKLQPNPGVKEIVLVGFCGGIILRWGEAQHNWGTLFANLVNIQIQSCPELQHLPLVSGLQHLKSMKLSGLEKVEYMEENIDRRSTYTGVVQPAAFFPSLENLVIEGMESLRGWWRSGECENDVSGLKREPPSFPRLKSLKIWGCPNLLTFPLIPTVKTLDLGTLNEMLEMNKGSDLNLVKLRVVNICHVGDLRALPPCNPTAIHIKDCKEETFSGAGVEELFRTCGSSSVRHLYLENCLKLRSLEGGGFQHLTALESISIWECRRLIVNEEDNNDGIAWKSLHHSLLSFGLCRSDMERLPKGMQYLTSLQRLYLSNCSKLEEIPEWISCLSSLHTLGLWRCQKIKSLPNAMAQLTSLQKLVIENCSKELHERCGKAPEGEDWPKIQHIPHLEIQSYEQPSS